LRRFQQLFKKSYNPHPILTRECTAHLRYFNLRCWCEAVVQKVFRFWSVASAVYSLVAKCTGKLGCWKFGDDM